MAELANHSKGIRKLERIIHEADLRHRFSPERYEPGKVLELDVTGVCPATKGGVKLLVEDFAGGGFAGQVYRVRVLELGSADLESTGLKVGERYAVKIHIPPSRRSRRFRNLLYWMGYQGPFAPQVNSDAARSGVLWQKLIRRGAKIRFGDERCVADTHATFFDPEMSSFGEINEWVEGRTWNFELDSDVFSRREHTAETARFSREYLAKKEFMAKFVGLLHEMGADELTRQYEWRTGKSQPNVYKRLDADGGAGKGLTSLDFRPGLALLFFLPMSPADFKLIANGLRRGALVQFDRGDLESLQKFCSAHPEEFESLLPALAELKGVDPRYRESQPDITRHRLRLLFDGELRRKVKSGLVRGWRRLRLADDDHTALLDNSALAFILFLVAGAVPVLGRFLRRFWGDGAFRTHVAECCRSPQYLRRTLRANQAECLIRWMRKGRTDDKGVEFFLEHPLIFSTLRVFPGLLPLPAKAHRCLVDWKYALERGKAALVFPLRFYRSSEYRVVWLSNEVEVGKSMGMLMPREKERILSQVKNPFIQKYLKCLAVHFCTFPVTKGVMILLALYAYFNFGNNWHESLSYAVASMIIITILPVSPGSFLRGSYVVYLMIKERNVRNYWVAALVSFWHYVGYLGFPLQMAKEFPALSRLIASRWVTGVVRVVPVFGESGALLEHTLFDLFVNVPLSIKHRLQGGKVPAGTVGALRMSGEGGVRRKVIPWWVWILGIDLFLLATTAVKQYPLSFPGKRWLVRHFNLAVEMNAAVWWSALCLLALALLAYELYSQKSGNKEKFAWLALSAVFTCLSLDELGSIHERIGGWSNLLPYGVVFGSLVACALAVLFRNPQTRRSALFIGVGISLFGSVALQEYLEHAGSWANWALGLRVALEEGSELLGMLLIFSGIVPHRAPGMTSSLRAIIPDPGKMKKIPEIVLIGGFLHILASMTVPGLIDVTEQGNPLAWYPVSVFFILFAWTLGYSDAPAAKPKMLPVLSLFFLLCSAGLAYDPPRLLPVIGSLVSREYLTGTFLISLSALLLLIGAVIPGFWDRNCRYLPLLLLLPLMVFLDARPEIRSLSTGVTALLAFTIYRRYERNAAGKNLKPEFSFPAEISSASAVKAAAARKTVPAAEDRSAAFGHRK